MKLIHPTRGRTRNPIPTNVRNMFHIRGIPNFNLSLLHNENLGDELETFESLNSFDFDSHGGNWGRNAKAPQRNCPEEDDGMLLLEKQIEEKGEKVKRNGGANGSH